MGGGRRSGSLGQLGRRHGGGVVAVLAARELGGGGGGGGGGGARAFAELPGMLRARIDEVRQPGARGLKHATSSWQICIVRTDTPAHIAVALAEGGPRLTRAFRILSFRAIRASSETLTWPLPTRRTGACRSS